MPEIEFDPVDSLAAGAVGEPGRRTFFIQATKEGRILSVLVEKEQVAVLSERLRHLVDQVESQFPGKEEEEPLPGASGEAPDPGEGELVGDPVPLFRAVAIGIGFDPARRMVLLELHERPVEEDEDEGEGDAEPAEEEEEEKEGFLARLYATPGQARAMAIRGTEAVRAGRPPCPLCGNPLDPEGHICPKLNGHARR
jgi:uncharacterized repeat protein (TIGR03847 family)